MRHFLRVPLLLGIFLACYTPENTFSADSPPPSKSPFLQPSVADMFLQEATAPNFLTIVEKPELTSTEDISSTEDEIAPFPIPESVFDPVKVASHQRYFEFPSYSQFANGVKYDTSPKHLLEDHGVPSTLIAGLTAQELNYLHGMRHVQEKQVTKTKSTVVQASAPSMPSVIGIQQLATRQRTVSVGVTGGVLRQACPGGVCNVRVGIFGRQRRR